MKRVFRLIVLILLNGLFSPISSLGQNYLIKTIQFNGLKYNKAHYLYKNIDSKIGQPLNIETINNDAQRINSLASVSYVTYSIDSIENENKVTLTFNVEELFTSAPIFNVGLVENNIWFKVGYSSLNLNGIGHQIATSYQYNDKNHSFDFFYKVPNWAKSKWGNSINCSRYSSNEPLFFDEGAVNYEYEIRNIGIATSYEFSRNNNLEVATSFFTENYKQAPLELQTLDVLPGPREVFERKTLSKITHTLKKEKYVKQDVDGWNNKLIFQYVNSIDKGDHFVSFSNELTVHKILGKKIIFASRFKTALAKNNASPFAPFVLDSYVNIRGAGNRVDRGTAQVVLNLELRHYLFEYKKIMGQMVVFSDQGNWRNPGGKLEELIQKENYRHFIGGGVRFSYLKGYNYIFRIDYGIDVYNFEEKGLIIGVGQYF